PFRDQRVRADDASPADGASGQKHRVHPDEDLAFYRASMDGDAMPDGHVFADHSRVRVVDVNRAIVLDVRSRSDRDRLDIAAKHRVKPNVEVVGECDVSNDVRTVGDEYPSTDRRHDAAIGVNWHRLISLVNAKDTVFALPLGERLVRNSLRAAQNSAPE